MIGNFDLYLHTVIFVSFIFRRFIEIPGVSNLIDPFYDYILSGYWKKLIAYPIKQNIKVIAQIWDTRYISELPKNKV